MKKTKIRAILTAVLCSATPVMSVSAATLNDVNPSNSTEVTANIVDPGYVSYTITIPETADFGTLSVPDNIDTDHYTFSSLSVVATELNIKSNQGVSVYMMDSASDDNQFYISQKDVSDPFKIAYDVYDTVVDEKNIGSSEPINSTGTLNTYGYHLGTFLSGSTGSTQNITLALNQNALYDQPLSDIAGDYSGTLNFHSALIEVS